MRLNTQLEKADASCAQLFFQLCEDGPASLLVLVCFCNLYQLL